MISKKRIFLPQTRRGLSSVVGALFFTVLMIAGFSVLSLALDAQTDIVTTQRIISDFEIQKQQEEFDKNYELAIQQKMKELEQKQNEEVKEEIKEEVKESIEDKIKRLEKKSKIQKVKEEPEEVKEDLDTLLNNIVKKEEPIEMDEDEAYELAIQQKMKELEELKKKKKKPEKKPILKDNYGLNLNDDSIFEEVIDFIDMLLEDY